MTSRRIEGTMHAIAVDLAHPHTGQSRVPHIRRPLAQFDPLRFNRGLDGIEEAEFNPLGVF